jgi:hypothetical protein
VYTVIELIHTASEVSLIGHNMVVANLLLLHVFLDFHQVFFPSSCGISQRSVTLLALQSPHCGM